MHVWRARRKKRRVEEMTEATFVRGLQIVIVYDHMIYAAYHTPYAYTYTHGNGIYDMVNDGIYMV